LYELNLIYKYQFNIYEEEVIPQLYKGFEMSSKRLDISIYSKNNDKTPLIILELKWIDTELEPWQLSNYMKLCNCKYGFLINFEKIGAHPINFCTNIYNEINQQLIFQIPQQKQGLVRILRFENNVIQTEQKCLGCGIVILTNPDKPRCKSCWQQQR
jgi:hypothetical protein